MRSISYVLGGKPNNMYDCLDYRRRHKVERVILNLHSVDEATETYVVRWLKGSFAWFFEDTTVGYDIVYGGCFAHESAERQRLSVENANARLAQDLATIRPRIGEAAIEGFESRFE
jgi:hypothetical protein